jgi:hypothetical protein
MALAQKGFTLTVSLVDAGGNQATKKYSLLATTYADAATATVSILSALAAVTAAYIKGYRLTEVYVDAEVTFAPAGVEVENRALIVGQTVTDAKPCTIEIPAPVDGVFEGATGPQRNIVDIDDTDLNTYTDLFAAGGVCDISDGDVLAALLSGKRIHRASRKG